MFNTRLIWNFKAANRVTTVFNQWICDNWIFYILFFCIYFIFIFTEIVIKNIIIIFLANINTFSHWA